MHHGCLQVKIEHAYSFREKNAQVLDSSGFYESNAEASVGGGMMLATTDECRFSGRHLEKGRNVRQIYQTSSI